MKRPSEIAAQVLAKADEDENFRTLLMSDPKEAIKDATGLALPEGINIRVVEDSATDFHLVLPPAGRKLSNAEMLGVAGGIGDIDTW